MFLHCTESIFSLLCCNKVQFSVLDRNIIIVKITPYLFCDDASYLFSGQTPMKVQGRALFCFYYKRCIDNKNSLNHLNDLKLIIMHLYSISSNHLFKLRISIYSEWIQRKSLFISIK